MGGRVALFGHVRFGDAVLYGALPPAARPPNYIGVVREPVAACISLFLCVRAPAVLNDFRRQTTLYITSTHTHTRAFYVCIPRLLQ
jgi:hypothetical protein